MRSVGELVKEARLKKKLSREKLESRTKIKKEFIEALEESRWDLLPEYPVVLGFVKNIADSLDLNGKHLSALLRRDYPPRNLKVNPNPEIKEGFKWSPKNTFLAGIIFVVLIVLLYLGYSYFKFIAPPYLKVEKPQEGQLVTQGVVKVSGKTDPEAYVIVNNQPAIVDENGSFETELNINDKINEIEIKARSRSGRETVIHRKIENLLGEQN